MGNARAGVLFHHLCKLLAAHGTSHLADAHLLERFAADHDEDAFAALVQRHGPMVLGVAGRVLRDRHDAEDVFQATFLVLARQAASVRRRGSVGSWLYGVAWRLARKAQAAAATRRRHEGQAAIKAVADPLDELTGRELGAVLDEELRRLPERYRAPLVLCYLEGRTQDESARQLGWSVRTFKRRLEAGRERLRARLTRRGLALSAALAASALTPSAAPAALPTALVATTVQAAQLLATGKAVAGAGVSASVAALAEGVLKTMFLTKVKFVAVVLLAGVVTAGTGVLAYRGRADKLPNGRLTSAAQPAPLVARGPPPEAEGPPGKDQFGDPLPTGALVRMGTVRLRHHHRTADLATAFSPDGKTVVTGGGFMLKMWDVATGKLLCQSPGGYYSAVFASHGRWLLTNTGDLLDPTSGQVIRRLSLDGRPLALSPDSSLVVTSAEDDSVTLWSTASGRVTRRLRGHKQPVDYGAFTPDGRTLITICRGKRIYHWDVATGALRQTVAMPVGGSIRRFSPDSRTLAISSSEGVSLWDTATGEKRGDLGEEAKPAWYGLAFSADGRTLATNRYKHGDEEAQVCLWNVASRKLLRRFPMPVSAVGFLYFAPDNRTLASSGSEPRLRLWDTVTGQQLLQQAVHDSYVFSLSFTPDGRTLVSGSRDGTIRAWDAATGQQRRELAGHRLGVYQVAVLPDGKRILSSGHDEQLHLQELLTGKELRRFSPEPPEGKDPNNSSPPIFALASDGQTAASSKGIKGTTTLIQFWDLATGRILAGRTDLSKAHPCAFSPDARVMASYASTYRPAPAPKGPLAPKMKAGAVEVVGTQVVLQDVATGRQLLALPVPAGGGYRAAFTPDGRTLVTETRRQKTDAEGRYLKGSNTLHLWELATGKERLTISDQEWSIRNDSYYSSLVSSSDGGTLATARWDGIIQVWDVATGKELMRRSAEEAPVSCLAFHPDGRVLASGHADSTILLWDLAPVRRRPAPDRPAPPGQLEQWWADLAGADARKAHAAIWDMVAVPERAVPLLRDRLSPAAGVPAGELNSLLADLDSDQFKRREAASKRLADLEELPESALEEALKANPSAEKRRRIEGLLAAPRVVRSPTKIRHLRAVEVLEYSGTPEARQVLAELANGSPAARLTQEAKASLERLAQRAAAEP